MSRQIGLRLHRLGKIDSGDLGFFGPLDSLGTRYFLEERFTLTLASFAAIPSSTMSTVHLLDYAAGNIRSLVNAIEKLGYTVEWVKSPDDVANAEVRTCDPIAVSLADD